MVHFNAKSITLDYLAIFQLFLIILKLTNKINWNWFMIFLPYIVATLLAIVGVVFVSVVAVLAEDEDNLK